MHLSDVMGHAGLAGYAIVAMILFMLAFAAIVWRVFQPSRRDEYERAGRLAVEDDAPPARPPGESE
jgi:cbb3-type cytochrome oxidase subunit 3